MYKSHIYNVQVHQYLYTKYCNSHHAMQANDTWHWKNLSTKACTWLVHIYINTCLAIKWPHRATCLANNKCKVHLAYSYYMTQFIYQLYIAKIFEIIYSFNFFSVSARCVVTSDSSVLKQQKNLAGVGEWDQNEIWVFLAEGLILFCFHCLLCW